jgi:hypothetical protein
MQELVRKNPWVHPVSLIEWLGPIIRSKLSNEGVVYDGLDLLHEVIALAEQNKLASSASPREKK